MNIGILTKPDCNTKKIISFLKEKGHNVMDIRISTPSSLDLLISHGGDGTVLAAMHYAVEYSAPLYAIDLGTLGFLHSGNEEDFYEDFLSFEHNQYSVIERSLLKVDVDGTTYLALNDVALSTKNPGKMIHVECSVNGNSITTYPADGVLVASATGSTAYSLSCNGPILDPEMNDIIITPISPHILSQRSIIVKYGKSIHLVSKDASMVIIDGQKSIDVKECNVSISEKSLKLISHSSKDFFNILRDKLCWGK